MEEDISIYCFTLGKRDDTVNWEETLDRNV